MIQSVCMYACVHVCVSVYKNLICHLCYLKYSLVAASQHYAED